jgi:phosphotriesterase-related protein
MEVTARTGVRFVMATGIYQRGDLIPEYFRHRDISALVEAFEHDLNVGIQGTSVRAAFIKTAVDEPGMTPGIEMVHRAAARASLSTGAPIMTHTHAILRTGLTAIDIFREEGVPLDRVQLAHVGDTDDLGYAEALLAAGCYIGMDRYGIDRRLTADRRNATVLELWRRGHGSKMILSHDWASTVDVFEPAFLAREYPNWSWTYIWEAALPEFRRSGMPEPDIQRMLGENIHRWLSSEA